MDADRIAEICTAAYRAAYRELLPPGYIERTAGICFGAARVARQVPADPPRWFGYQVAEEGDRLVGAAGGGLTRPGIGELHLIYLDPAERGRGLGTLLLDRVIAQIREAGGTEVWLSVFLGDGPGIGFYRSRGFQPMATVQADLSREDDHIRSLRMRRALR
ncbi:Protease synthase and sporulation negative regulatory protein PAI 1 [Actinoplanes sp. SE50]|nr:Protease synthase and sporulation negative regulatory protein PAI 1 [Actinoplanes sp. SE50/110]ATO84979.1 Protease synthase and sporulation negative regulatory protein PAI 1 [Actinoplanes sp. SE50]SLM02388.1 Protease synthase and sporulation negative regulatory protein PAI 1 [Actinoplanes sp. SE50/110]